MTGSNTDNRKFSIEGIVPCYDVDVNKKMKPSAFMDLAQEMAYRAASSLGFGYEALQTEGKAWVLSRMHYRFLRHPEWREEFRMSTWHKGPYGPFYLRDFSLSGKDGETMVLCTSSWVILDVASRRMCRTSEIMGMVPEETVCKDDAIAEPAEKIIMPKGIEPQQVGIHTVRYSDVDILGHTNNARYIIWSMDCIDFDELKLHPVREVTVNFNHETKAGESVLLEKARVGNNDGSITYYIDGKLDGKSAFTVKILL